MYILSNIGLEILTEQEDSKMMMLKKAITKRIPLTINYSGPPEEVKSGQRIDIEPIVMGTNAKSGNLVIWAYVFKGVSKKGLPNWKMFRVDRITSLKYNLGAPQFKLGSLPGYEKGKAPDSMRSLGSVITFSPYWYEGMPTTKPEVKPIEKPEVPIPSTEPLAPTPIEPEITATPIKPITTEPITPSGDVSGYAYDNLKSKMKDVNGEKIISKSDYDTILRDIYRKKEDEWKVYQRKLQGNVRPGEGTRQRFTNASKSEIDNFLNKDNIKVSDQPIGETYSRRLRMLDLIYS